MRITFFLCLTLLFTLTLSAQTTLKVSGEPELIVDAAGGFYLNPKPSPDGKTLAFTQSAYQGIWLTDLDGNNPNQLTDATAAGFGFTWSPDGSAILSRIAKTEGRNRLNAIVVYDLDAQTSNELSDWRAIMPNMPFWNNNGMQVAYQNESERETFSAGRQNFQALTSNNSFVDRIQVQNNQLSQIAQASGNVTNIKAMEGEQTILNQTDSPAGGTSAFQIMGGNLFILSADNQLIDLGRGFRPQWSQNGEWLVFMVSEDDGHEYTGSELYAVRKDGSERIQLTNTPNHLEMNPAFSADGKAIYYDDQGSLYRLNLE